MLTSGSAFATHQVLDTDLTKASALHSAHRSFKGPRVSALLLPYLLSEEELTKIPQNHSYTPPKEGHLYSTIPSNIISGVSDSHLVILHQLLETHTSHRPSGLSLLSTATVYRVAKSRI